MCLFIYKNLDSDNEVVRSDNEATDSRTIEDSIATSGQSRRSLLVKNRLHRTRVGIELDRLPDHVTAHTGNTSRKRRPTSPGSHNDVTSPAETIRRCEQWVNDVRRAAISTSGVSVSGGHIGTVTVSGCLPAAGDDKLT